MNAFSRITAAPSTLDKPSGFGPPSDAARAERAAMLATELRAKLAVAKTLTEDPMLLNQIGSVTSRINRLERFEDIGMLGRNGIAPHVEMILSIVRRRLGLTEVTVSADRLSVAA